MFASTILTAPIRARLGTAWNILAAAPARQGRLGTAWNSLEHFGICPNKHYMSACTILTAPIQARLGTAWNILAAAPARQGRLGTAWNILVFVQISTTCPPVLY